MEKRIESSDGPRIKKVAGMELLSRIKMAKMYVFLVSAILCMGCQQEQKTLLSADQKLNLANTFYNNELYQAAISEYSEFLTNYDVDNQRRANITYRIADIYFERLFDYDKALEYYLRVKHLYPESNLQSEVGKRIVNCLERLQRSQDAQRVLEKETALKPEEVETHRPGQIIAKIGDKEVTQGDLDFELNQMPPYIREQFSSPAEKLEFLRQYIVEELLYDSAKRKGLDKDKEIIEGTFRAKKRLMAQQILSDEIKDKVNISQADVELYYKANKEKYVEKDDNGKVIRQKEFAECAQQVAQDLLLERQQKVYNQIVERLTKAENVTIYEKRIR
jgi:tetratricopeptide (TPR) repeat protein